jgi:hypothetical protein
MLDTDGGLSVDPRQGLGDLFLDDLVLGRGRFCR